jgi:hypothetical protein
VIGARVGERGSCWVGIATGRVSRRVGGDVIDRLFSEGADISWRRLHTARGSRGWHIDRPTASRAELGWRVALLAELPLGAWVVRMLQGDPLGVVLTPTLRDLDWRLMSGVALPSAGVVRRPINQADRTSHVSATGATSELVTRQVFSALSSRRVPVSAFPPAGRTSRASIRNPEKRVTASIRSRVPSV